MAFRAPTILYALFLCASCYDGEIDDADTAAPPERTAPGDTDADVDTDSDIDDTAADPALEPATAQGLCDTVFALCDDAWGWADTDTCAESWLGEGQDWQCADIPAYLSCAAPCLEAQDCEAFGTCEVPCWDAHCL
jgi:hypothetical protein